MYYPGFNSSYSTGQGQAGRIEDSSYKPLKYRVLLGKDGANDLNRTDDLFITSELVYVILLNI